MAKEPAGLRRWRLAHRKHKRKRVVHHMAKRRRRYYGRKRKGHRGSKAIPLIQTGIIALPYVSELSKEVSVNSLIRGTYQLTGFDATPGTNKWTDPKKGVMNAVALVLLSTVGAKVANKVGANRMMKKVSAGYIKLM